MNSVQNYTALRRSKTSVPPRIYCKEFRTELAFSLLEAQWQELFADCSYQTPFCTWEWSTNWWRFFGACSPILKVRGILHIVTVYEETDRIIGLFPFYCDIRQGSALQPQSLRLFGDNAARREHSMTEEPTLLLRRGRERDAVTTMLDHLIKTSGSRKWDFLNLHLYCKDSTPILSDALKRLSVQGIGYRQKTLPGPETVELPTTWTAFRQTLSKSMRDNLAYYPRLLSRHGYRWSVRLVTAPADMEAAVALLVNLHHRRAASERGVPHDSHILTDTHYRLFLESMRLLSRREMACVFIMEVDGEAIAAQAFLESREMLIFYYSGFDPRWYDYSPITLLGAEAIQYAIRRGVKKVNFLPEQLPWKERWGAKSDMGIEEVVCVSNGVGSFARMAWHYLSQHRRGPKG